MQLRALLHKTLARFRTTAERWSHLLPLTWRGFFVALASGLALEAYGYASLDLLLFVIGISGLVITVLSCLMVVGATLYLRRRLVDDATGARQLEAGSPIRTGFHTPSLVRLPLVHIHWRWVEPEGVDCRLRLRDGRLKEEVVARRRCLVGGIHRRITVYDAFGLARMAWDHRVSAPLQVLPDVGRLRRMPVLQSMAAAEGTPHPAGTPEGDRMEIRRYVPGDSPRHILWKIYARTGQLNVRLPERSIDPAKKTVAYLLTGEGDEASAAAARVALENGLLGVAWLFALLAGFGIPVLRASILLTSFSLGRLSARAVDSWNALAGAVLVTGLLRPEATFGVGWFLTYGATASLLLLTLLLQCRL